MGILAVVWLATFALQWEFDRSYTPQPDTFVLLSATETGQTLDTMQTPVSVVGACAAMGGNPGADIYCTQWPTCPAPGVMVFFVQAAWGEEASAPSELMTCVFDAQTPCVCHDPATYVPPTGGPVVIPPLPPGDIPPVTHVSLPALPPFAPVFPPAPT